MLGVHGSYQKMESICIYIYILSVYQIEYWPVFFSVKSLRTQQIEYSTTRHCKRYDYNILSLDFRQHWWWNWVSSLRSVEDLMCCWIFSDEHVWWYVWFYEVLIFYLLISDSTGDGIGFRPFNLFKIWCVVDFFSDEHVWWHVWFHKVLILYLLISASTAGGIGFCHWNKTAGANTIDFFF